MAQVNRVAHATMTDSAQLLHSTPTPRAAAPASAWAELPPAYAAPRWKTLAGLSLWASLAFAAGGAQAAASVSKDFLTRITGPIGSAEVAAGTVNRGDVVTMRIDVLNSGNLLNNGGLTDHLPTGMTLAAVPNPRASSGCGGAISYSAVGGASTFAFSAAEVPAQSGGTPGLCSVYVDVAVPLTLGTASNTTVTLNNSIAAGNSGDGFTGTDTLTSSAVSTSAPSTRSLSVRSLRPLTANKSFSPSTINMGETSTIRIVLDNPNSVSTTVSQLAENLPGHVVATSTTPTLSGSGCTAATATASGTSGNTVINFTGLTLPANGACTVNWTVRGLASNGASNNTAPAQNTIPANSLVNDRSLPQAATSAGLTVQSPLAPYKTLAPSPTAANQPVTMYIVLINQSSTQTLSGVGFNDALPAGMSLLASPVTGSAACGNFSGFTPTAGATSLVMSGLGLAPSAVCTVSAQVQVNAPGDYTNTIPLVNYTSDNPNVGTRQSGPASASLTAYDQITLAKAALDPRSSDSSGAGSVAPGNLVRYRLTLSNYSSALQSGITVTDPLPLSGGAQVVFVNSPAPSYSNCGAPTLGSTNGASSATFSNVSIPAGNSASPTTCVIEFHAQLPGNWPVGTAVVNGSNSAPVTVTQGGPNLIQGGQPNTTTPTVAPFSVAKAVAAGTVFQGGSTTVTLTLVNTNFADLTGVSLLDNPLFNATGSPSQVTLASPASPSTTCAGSPVYTAVAGSTSFQVSGLTVPQRGQCTVSFKVTGVVPGAGYVNTIAPADVSGSVVINGAAPVTLNPAAAATAALTVNSVLDVNKSFAPAAVGSNGGVSRVTVQIDNLGGEALTGLRVSDPLPASLVLAATPNASSTCAGPVTLSASPGASSATLSGATLAANSRCLFQFDVVTNGTGGAAASVNTIPAGNVTADHGVFNASAASASLNKLSSSAVVNVTKSFTPATLTAVGQSSRLQVLIDNTLGGAVPLSQLALTDNLPTGMAVADVAAPSTTCTGGVVAAAPRSGSVGLSGATLAAAATCVFEADVTLVDAGVFNNTIPAAAVQNAQGISNPNPFTANLQALASLGVAKSFNPTAVAPGGVSRLTVQLINSQALQINLLGLSDVFPSGLVAASPAAASTTCPGGVVAVAADRVTLTDGRLPAASGGVSSRCEVSLNVTAAVQGAYVNTIPVGGATGTDGNGGQTQNATPASATLNVRADVPISKSFAAATVRVGQGNRLSISISNAANSVALTQAALTDNLPSGVSVAPIPNASSSNCGSGAVVTANAGDTQVRLSGATLAAGATCVVAVDVLSNTPGVYTNTIPDHALQTAEGVSNAQPASASFRTWEPPTVGKEFNPVQVAAGGISQLRIVLGNINASALTTSASFSDTLPAGLTLASPALDTLTTDALPRCANASGAGSTVTVGSGTTLPAGGCVVIANVTGTTLGQFTNTIEAGALQTNGGNSPSPAIAVLSISTRNAISGKVYLDADNNGSPGSAELPLAAQSVVLEQLDGSGSVIATHTTTSNSLGNYSFLDLPDSGSGSFRLRQPAQAAGTLNGLTRVGTLGGGSATGVAAVPSAISGISLNGGQNATGYHFGELLPAAVSGRVFLDLNNDGTAQSADSAIAGVTLTLQGSDDLGPITPQTITTAADGSYQFINLRPGTYTVVEPTQPLFNGGTTANGITRAGSVSGGNGSGTPGTASAVATTPSAVSGIVLVQGSVSPDNNFAETANGQISGRVYGDGNNNGSIDGTETGIAGVTVVLNGVDSQGTPVSASTVTLADGSYRFSGLPAGTYAVTEPTQPPLTVNGITSPGTVNGTPSGSASAVSTTPSAISAIVLPLGGVSIDNNFGEMGDSPDLLISKSHSPARFTTRQVGSYTLTVRNAGQRASSGVYTVSDRLPAGLTLAATPTGSGWTCTGAAGDSSFSCTSSSAIAAGATSAQTVLAPVNVADSAATGSPLDNVALVDGGGEIAVYRPSAAELDAFNNNPAALPVCDAAVLHNACRNPTPVQLAASLSGTVWFDIGSSLNVLDTADRRLPNWRVEVLDAATGALLATTTTAANGSYVVNDLAPGVPLTVRFRDPSSNVVFGAPVNGETAPASSGASCNPAAAVSSGSASSCVQTAPTTSLGVVLAPGQNLAQQSLPIDPSGVVFDATTRQPVPGSVVTLAPAGICAAYDPATSLVNVAEGGYTLNGSSAAMTVGADGFYQFLFAPSAPASCTFTLSVTPPSGYRFVSTLIPPAAGPLLPPGGPGSTYAVQPQPTAPTAQPGTGTTYYLSLNSGSAGANIIHNHIPLDPVVPTALVLSKSGDKRQAEVGDTVRYTVTVRQVAGDNLSQVTVRDRLPAGFTLVRGTVQVNGAAVADPAGGLGPTLAFNLGPITLNGRITLSYRLRVGVGSAQGDGTNRAQAFGCGTPAGCLVPGSHSPIAGATPSNEGRHTVTVGGGVFTDRACVLGKVFVDCNHNHVQDAEELGVPGVRFYFEDGSWVVSDSEGKYSQCDLAPQSHVLKVDPLTLPRGSRLTTSSNRNLGDAGSLFIDLKNGELHRADVIEGSCSNTVLEQVRARRSQGEVRSLENEKKKGPALKFVSKPRSAPTQATDSANQPLVQPRTPAAVSVPVPARSAAENHVPVPELPLFSPAASAAQGGAHVR